MISKNFLLLCIFLLSSCAFDDQDPQHLIDPVVELLGPAPISISENEIVGTGRVKALAQLRSPRENFHLHIAGQFLESSSFLTLHLFFDDFQNDTGILLRLRPTEIENQRGHIDVDFAEPGQSYRHLTQISESIGPDLRFILRIEALHQMNNEKRLIIWNDALFLDSNFRERRDRLTFANSDFDSLHDHNIFFSWGRGYNWGLNLNRMRLQILRREVPIEDS